MSAKVCDHCQRAIPAGESVERSRSFVVLAWHRECYQATHAAPVIPAQRQSADARVSR